MLKTPALHCPVCHEVLSLDERTWHCSNKHSFDRAREGYVNLLLPQHKSSRNPGDSKEMMQHRQHFLNAGYYHHLVITLASIIAEHRAGELYMLLDAGCGEGYYMDAISALLRERQGYSLAGVDIAKEGVRLAAKRKVFDQLAVASVYKLPYSNDSLDGIYSVFSPISNDEFYRILKPGGTLIAVGPGTNHLRSLAEKIYDKVVPHTMTFSAIDQQHHFTFINEQLIESEITVAAEHLLSLLKMTPYYWHATQEQQQSLAELEQLVTPVSFAIHTYKKRQ